MEIRIYKDDCQGDEFYSLMGPFFADKNFLKIFGEPLHNEPKSTWFVAVDKKEVVGFCTVFQKNKYAFLNQFFVVDGYKNKGVGSSLFDTRLDFLKDVKEIRAMVKEDKSFHLYKKNKFSVYGKRGNYSLVKRIGGE